MTDNNSSTNTKFLGILILGLCLILGNLVIGWFVFSGLYNIKVGDRYVSVKGLSERRVKADLAVWNINFKTAGDDLQQTNAKILSDQRHILAFLSKNGFQNNEITLQQTTVIDQYATEYAQQNKPEHRYIVNSGINVRTEKVDLIRNVSSMTGELIMQGIILEKDFAANPRYSFTKLDNIRPTMLEEATKSARAVAQQFALNSNSKLNGIKHASQGVFQIFSADNAASQQQSDADQEQRSLYKTVRLVSSIDYFLQNQ